MLIDQILDKVKDIDLTSFLIEVSEPEGNFDKLPETFPVLSWTIENAINQIPKASLTILDGKADNSGFERSEHPLVKQGNAIKISVGYHNADFILFEGVINSLKAEVVSRGCTQLYLDCRHKSYQMTLKQNSRNYSIEKVQSEAEVMKELLTPYKIAYEVQLNQKLDRSANQYQQSDWDYMVSRAERIGGYVYIVNDEIGVGLPELKSDPPVLTYGEDIYDFTADMDNRTQFKGVSVRYWDSANKKMQNVTTVEPNISQFSDNSAKELAQSNGDPVYVINHDGELSRNEAAAIAKAQMIKFRLSKVQGSVKIQGTPDFAPGDTVRIEGMGKRFEGPVFISGVHHHLENGDWKTTLILGLDTEWHYEKYDMKPDTNPGRNASINGLHYGIVKNLVDPNGLQRIKVNIPILNDEEHEVWARLVTLHAGNDRGTVFRPEIGDEVMLGFVNDDPNEVVILGALHTSNNPAPYNADGKNLVKGYKSTKGLEFFFHEDELSIKLSTPAGNVIWINEQEKGITIEDQNKNTVVLNDQGITIESYKDMTIKAANNLSIEAANVSINAKQSAEVKGNQMATFEGAGTAYLKGGNVMIN